MASKKLHRINEDIQRTLASLLREVKDPRVQQGIISVTAAVTTGDLRYCKVYLSVLGLDSEKEFLKGLRSASGYLRRELGNALDIRYTPELIFEMDNSIEHGSNISKIIHEINAGDEVEAVEDDQ